MILAVNLYYDHHAQHLVFCLTVPFSTVSKMVRRPGRTFAYCVYMLDAIPDTTPGKVSMTFIALSKTNYC